MAGSAWLGEDGEVRLQVIKGSAGEWSRLAVRRMPAADVENLIAVGDTAETALRVASAFP